MSSKLKMKPKKMKPPLNVLAAPPNTYQQDFKNAMLNARDELKEMERKAYEDGFNDGEDWSDTVNTVTFMMALRKLYGFSTARLLKVIKASNEFVKMANEGQMTIIQMMKDIEDNTEVRFDQKYKNMVERIGL